MQFPQSDQTIRMNQILASDHHCLYMLWALLSLVLDHLFQYQQCWQCFRTDNHRSHSIAGWCILHSHQLCPSYGSHCKCWGCWKISFYCSYLVKFHNEILQIYAWPGHAMRLSRQALAKALTLRCKADARACGLLYASRHQAQTALLFWYPTLGNHTDGNIKQQISVNKLHDWPAWNDTQRYSPSPQSKVS